MLGLSPQPWFWVWFSNLLLCDLNRSLSVWPLLNFRIFIDKWEKRGLAVGVLEALMGSGSCSLRWGGGCEDGTSGTASGEREGE